MSAILAISFEKDKWARRKETRMSARSIISMAILASLLVLSLLLAGCDAGSATTPTATPATGSNQSTGTAQPGAGNSRAADYCTSKGGQVVTRHPVYGYGGSNPLELAGSLQFCQFTAQDKSMIAISLDTL